MRMNWQKTAAIVGCAVLSTYGITVTPGAGANAAPAVVATSLVSGSVLDVTGKPAAGAKVIVTAWPDGATLDSTPDAGGTAATNDVPVTTVSSTTTNASGAYSVNSDLNKLPTQYRDASGMTNLEIDTWSGGDLQTTFVPAAAAGSPIAAAPADNPDVIVQGTVPAKIDFNIKAATVTTTVGTAAAVTSNSPTTEQATTTPMSQPNGDALLPPPNGCTTWVSQAWYPKRKATSFHVYTYHAHAILKETTSSSDTAGVGVAVTGGGWSASGSYAVTASSGQYGERDFGLDYTTSSYLNAHHWARRCWATGVGYWYQHSSHASSVAFLLTYAARISPRSWYYPYCTQPSSGKYGKSAGYNYDYGLGFQAPFIDVHNHVAYSTHTTLEFDVIGPTNLCTSSSGGFQAAAQVGAANGEHCKIGTTLPDGTDPDGYKQESVPQTPC